jgi:hypothetical protein
MHPRRGSSICDATKLNASSDESLYLQVAKELSANLRNEALWTKAYALENGDEGATKAHYIRLRVEQLARHPSHHSASAKSVDAPATSCDAAPRPHEDLPIDQPDPLAMYKALIGTKNQAYYVSHFSRFAGSRATSSWNWAAFIFFAAWALYRRLYGLSAMLLLVGIITVSLDKVAQDSLLSYSLFIALQIIFGAYANWLYFRKCGNEIALAKRIFGDKPAALPYLQKRGGVHPYVIYVGTAIPVLGILLAIMIPAMVGMKTNAAGQQRGVNPTLAAPSSPTALPAEDPKTPSFLANSNDITDVQPHVIPKPAHNLSAAPLILQEYRYGLGQWECVSRRGQYVLRRFNLSLHDDGTMIVSNDEGHEEGRFDWIGGDLGTRAIRLKYEERQKVVEFDVQSVSASRLVLTGTNGFIAECQR